MIVFCSINDRARHRGIVLNTATGNMPFARLDFFVPGWDLVMDHKRGRISDAEYIAGYSEILRERKSEVMAWLRSLDAQQDYTLLCFCPEGKFCHRILIAKLIERYRPDIAIKLH